MTKRYIWYPSRRYVELISTRLVPVLFQHYDPGSPNFQYLGAQGIGALESALAQPQQTFDGRYLYRSIFEKAAALIWSITKNHPFVDGNKRVTLVTGFSFLAVNNNVGVFQHLFLHRTKCLGRLSTNRFAYSRYSAKT